jgi:hypothetical protein
MIHWKNYSPKEKSRRWNIDRFLSKLKLEFKKLCVDANMVALLATTLEVEKVFGKLGKTPFEPFKEEQEEFMSGRNVTIEKHAQVLGSSLVNFFQKKKNC